MKKTQVVLAGSVLGLVVVALLRAAPEPVPPKVSPELLKARITAARTTYEVVWKNNKEALVLAVELVYRWSRRWLEAELELAGKLADQLRAYEAHSSRMQKLAQITRDRFRNRIVTIDEVSATDFYNAEAGVWLEQHAPARK
jgi:hypothetical protein